GSDHGTGLPVPQSTWLVAGSYDPVTHIAPPPVCHALFLSFQVSLPGSPGAGITYLRHASLPLAASTATMKSRVPRSPPEAPMIILSFTASGAAEKMTPGWPSPRFVSHTTLPVSLLVAIMRGG